MIFLFLFYCFAVCAVSHSLFQSERRALFVNTSNSSFSSLEAGDEALPPVCQNTGTRNVLVDALTRSQTLEWGIGSVTGSQAPIACRSSMSMDYEKSWQYAVTKINWKSQVHLPAATQAVLSLSWAFDPSFPRLAGAVRTFSEF
jgi:hypothetical protein